MSEDFEIINKVANSGLVNFDISDLVPKGKRLGIDIKDFLWEGMILKEKDFREKIKNIDEEIFRDAYVYIAGLEYVAISIFPASDTAVFCCT